MVVVPGVVVETNLLRRCAVTKDFNDDDDFAKINGCAPAAAFSTEIITTALTATETKRALFLLCMH